MQYLYWPLDKIFITQKFGERPDYYEKYGLKGHDGIDLRTRFTDSPLGHRYVSAAADGVVEDVRYDRGGYGTHLRIRHPDGSLTIYGHNSKLYVVTKGQHVKAQQIIALSGSTGDSSAPHVHFEYRPPNCDKNNGYAGAIDQTELMLTTLPKQFFG